MLLETVGYLGIAAMARRPLDSAPIVMWDIAVKYRQRG
jgi:hypothetical protein